MMHLGEVIVEALEPQIINRIILMLILHKLSADIIGWKIIVKKGSDMPSNKYKNNYIMSNKLNQKQMEEVNSTDK